MIKKLLTLTLTFALGYYLSTLLPFVLVGWLEMHDPVVVRCDGGEGQTPLITERDEYD